MIVSDALKTGFNSGHICLPLIVMDGLVSDNGSHFALHVQIMFSYIVV